MYYYRFLSAIRRKIKNVIEAFDTNYVHTKKNKTKCGSKEM